MNRDIQTKELIDFKTHTRTHSGDRGNSKFLIALKNRICNCDKCKPRENLRLTGCYLYK